ncbi:MAG TPA: methyltransferase domain-containing protein [Ktedonobacterales bacterium]
MSKQELLARPVAHIEDGRKVLRVGGIIQSVEINERHVPDVWDAMLPNVRPANALILGLGGGSIATLMTGRWGPLPITGIERDPEVVRLARAEFGLDRLDNLSIVTADAFAWVHSCAGTFDAVCVDLFHAGKLAHGALGPNFLRDLRRVLAPGGELTYNLWHSAYLDDQVRRIGAQFVVQSLDRADGNVIIRATRTC